MTELQTLVGLVVGVVCILGFLKILTETAETQIVIGFVSFLLGGVLLSTFGNTIGGGVFTLAGILFLALGCKRAFRI